MVAHRIVGVRRATMIAALAAAATILSSSARCALAFAVPRGPIGGGRPKMEPLSATTDNDDASNGDKAVVAADGPRKKKVVVVGGGWAGFTAASTLASSQGGGVGVDVTLLDASPRGRGGLAGGWRTSGGRPVEAGIHGFWREYRNTFAVMESIEGVELDDVLTPYTPSVLVSERGRVALAPVLGDDDQDGGGGGGGTKGGFKPPTSLSPEAVLGAVAPLLPPPLDVALLSEFSPASPLNVADRLSAVGLLGAWADFNQEDKDSWDRYDSVTAEDLFKKYAGVTDGLYDELVSPLLHVLPMCPGYDCSAAAALSCFHVFALQTRGAFDVRWCRGGIAEKIFNPWATQLMEGGNVEIRGGARVTSIDRLGGTEAAPPGGGGADGFPIEVELNGGEDTLKCDAVILAVGGTAASNIASSSPALRSLPATQNFDRLRGVTCVAVRLFLKPRDVVTSDLEGGKHGSTRLPPDLAEAMRDSPVFVCGPKVGGMPALDETGFCIYDLQRLHDEFAVVDDGSGTRDDDSGEGGDEPTAVLEVDFFRADDIANIEDDADVAELALKAVAEATGTKVIPNEDIIDVAVVRARNAVSHFAPSSASYSPPSGGKIGDNIYMCGDWIDRTGHASWSTEKAVVTGKQAGAAVARELGLACKPEDMKVIPAAEDTDQLKALRTAARLLRSVAPPPDRIPPSPWKFAESLIGGKLQR